MIYCIIYKSLKKIKKIIRWIRWDGVKCELSVSFVWTFNINIKIIKKRKKKD